MFKCVRFSLMLPLLACLWMAGGASAAPASQPEKHPGSSYITGGIGEDEVKEFRAAASKYNLRMTFASKAGNYLSDVDVMIADAGGRTVLAVRTEGPFLFVRLPSGLYRVSAQTPRMSEYRKVQVPARGGVNLNFSWDAPDAPGVMKLCKGCPKPRH